MFLLKFTESLTQQGLYIESESTGKNIRDTEARIRCFVMSMLPSNIWAIQRTFYVPSIFNSSVLNNMDLLLNGVQVCVRNCNVIKLESIKIIRSVTKTRAIDNMIIKECEET